MRTYTVEEVAEVLKATRWQIRKWLREKKIRAVKVGKRWVITHEELERILREGIDG